MFDTPDLQNGGKYFSDWDSHMKKMKQVCENRLHEFKASSSPTILEAVWLASCHRDGDLPQLEACDFTNPERRI